MSAQWSRSQPYDKHLTASVAEIGCAPGSQYVAPPPNTRNKDKGARCHNCATGRTDLRHMLIALPSRAGYCFIIVLLGPL